MKNICHVAEGALHERSADYGSQSILGSGPSCLRTRCSRVGLLTWPVRGINYLARSRSKLIESHDRSHDYVKITKGSADLLLITIRRQHIASALSRHLHRAVPVGSGFTDISKHWEPAARPKTVHAGYELVRICTSPR